MKNLKINGYGATTVMRTTISNLTVMTGMDILNSAIQRIAKEIQNHNVTLGVNTGSFYLMLEEALVNAMEHGNKWDPEKKINVSLQLDQFSLYIIIADEGEGFCQLALAGDDKNHLKEGIRLIRKFCNPYWNDKGNAIYLKLPLLEEKRPDYTEVMNVGQADKKIISEFNN